MTLAQQIKMNNGIGGTISKTEPAGTWLADFFAEPAPMKHFAVQLTIGGQWKTIADVGGRGTAAETFREWAEGKAAHEVVEMGERFGFLHFGIGPARFRLVPVAEGETVV